MRYEFTFARPLSKLASAAFPELALSSVDGRERTLFGPGQDHAELDGQLARFRALGLEITAMHRLPD